MQRVRAARPWTSKIKTSTKCGKTVDKCGKTVERLKPRTRNAWSQRARVRDSGLILQWAKWQTHWGDLCPGHLA